MVGKAAGQKVVSVDEELGRIREGRELLTRVVGDWVDDLSVHNHEVYVVLRPK